MGDSANCFPFYTIAKIGSISHDESKLPSTDLGIILHDSFKSRPDVLNATGNLHYK